MFIKTVNASQSKVQENWVSAVIKGLYAMVSRAAKAAREVFTGNIHKAEEPKFTPKPSLGKDLVKIGVKQGFEKTQEDLETLLTKLRSNGLYDEGIQKDLAKVCTVLRGEDLS